MLKEKLLIKILNSFSETSNIKEIKKKVVTETGRSLSLQTCAIYEFDKDIDNFLPMDNYGEYLASEEYPSDIGQEKTIEIHKDIIQILKKREGIIFSSQDELLNKYQVINYKDELINYYKKYRIESGVILPIIYTDELLGIFSVNYDYEKIFKEEEQEFFKILTTQFGAIFYQAKLYEKEKQTSKREQLLRNIISKTRKTLDIEKIKKLIVTEIGKLFKADRCLIREFDQKMEYFLPPTPCAEFLISNDVKSLTGYCSLPDSTKIFQKMLNNKKMIVTDDTDRFIKENNLTGTMVEVFIKDFSVKSGIVQLVLSYEDKILGLLALHYTREKVKLSKKSIDFIKSVADEISIAMHQSKLYEKEKQRARREALQRKIVETVRSTLDINTVKKTFVDKIGKFYDVDRVFFVQYDPETDGYLPIDEYSEYLPASNVSSFIGFKPESADWIEFIDLLKKLKEFNFSTFDSYISECNLKNTGIERIFKHCGVKSGFNFLITYRKETLGFICIDFISKSYEIKDEDYYFLRSLTSQFGVALFHAKLYEKERKSAAREAAIRKIARMLRNSLDINEIKQTFVDEVGKYLHADRVFLSEFDEKNKIFLPVDDYSEYLSEPDIKSLKGFDFTGLDVKKIFTHAARKEGFVYANREEFIEEFGLNKKERNHVYEFDVKSAISIPAVYMGNHIGAIVVHSVKRYVKYTEQEVEFVRTVADQAAIAIIQARLYEAIQQAAQREQVLRRIIETVRSSLDINIIKEQATLSICKILDADRCFIVELDKEKKLFKEITYEYLSSPEEISLIGFNPSIGVPEIANLVRTGNEVIAFDFEKFLEENNLQNTLSAKTAREQGVKTALVLPICYGDEVYGGFTVHCTKEVKFFSDEQMNLARAFNAQIGVALYQAELYKKEKQTAERENLQRKFAEIVRSTLNLNEFKKITVDETGKAFKANRCFIAVYDKRSNSFERPEIQYLASENLNKIESFEPYQDSIRLFGKIIENEGGLYIGDTEQFVEENKLKGSETEKYYQQYSIKSDYSLKIWDTEEEKAYIVIQYTTEPRYLTPDEVELHRYLTNQAAIAFQQAKLYEEIKNTAEREILLRKVIQAIRSSLDIGIIKRELVTLIGEYFNADRCFIAEFNRDLNKFVNIQYEYLSPKEDFSLIGFNPGEGVPEVSEIVNRRGELLSFDYEKFFEENDLQNSLSAQISKIHRIKSMFVFPTIYADKLYGSITLQYTHTKKILSGEQVELLRTVAAQTGIALNQVELFEKEKRTAERERLLREIIEAIRSTLDVKKITKIFVDSIGKSLSTSKTYISEFDPDNDTFKPVKKYAEYLKSTEEKSNVGLDLRPYEFYIAGLKDKRGFSFSDSQIFIKDNNLVGCAEDYYLKEYGVRSAIVVPIIFADNILASLTLQFSEPNAFGQEEIEFAQILAKQAAIAIHQARLYEKERQSAEREGLLREIIQSIRSTLSISEIKKLFVTEVAPYFNADRMFISEYDEKNDNFSPIDDSSQYLSSTDIKSLIDFDLTKSPTKPFADIFKQGKELILPDVTGFLRANNLQGTDVEKFADTYSILSTYAFPIIYTDSLLGIFILDYTFEKKNIKEEDINFLRILANQAGIALYQAKLYEKEKQTAERERLIREIIETTRRTLNINKVKSSLVKKLGKTYFADRCLIIELSPEGNIINIDKSSEYLSSNNIKSLVGVNLDEEKYKHWILATLQEEVFMPDSEKYIQEHSIQETPAIEHLQEYNIKSALAVPIVYGARTLGVLAFHYTRTTYPFSEEDRIFLKTVANQAGIAIYQGELYEKEKQTAERESLLRDVSETIRSTLEISEIKRKIVDAIGKTVGADQCIIFDFDSQKDIFLPIDCEYLSSPDIFSSLGGNPEEDVPEIITISKSPEEIIAPDTEKFLKEKNLLGTKSAELFKSLGIKSNYGIPILYKEKLYGVFIIHYMKAKRHLTDNELSFLRAVAVQGGTAFYQAELYEKEKQAADRERVLREVTETIRSSLDIGKIKQEIVTNLGLSLNAQRVFISEFDEKKQEFLPITKEFLARPDLKSMMDFDVQETAPELVDATKVEIFIEDIEKFLVEKNIEKSISAQHLREYRVKSGFVIPIIYVDHLLGVLGIHFTERTGAFGKDEVQFAKILANQTAIGLYQAKLYESQKQLARREQIIRETIAKMRESLDTSDIKKTFVNATAEYLDADITYFYSYDEKKEILLPVDENSEYRKTQDLPSFIGEDVSVYKTFTAFSKTREILPVTDIQKDFLDKLDLAGSPEEKFCKKYTVTSGLFATVFYKDELFGLFSIVFNERREVLKEEIDFVEILRSQAGFALYQAELYEKEKQTAKKEGLLREIISEVRSSQSIDEAYNYILAKITNVFDTDGCIFLETPTYRFEEPTLKYKYMKKDLDIKETYFDKFKEAGESLSPVIIHDCYGISSMLAVPFIRYNSDIKLFGIIALCSAETREWTNEDIALLEAVGESVVNILWDITKLVEIDELRNTFMLTLAHDLHVPVIGEKTALEFISSRPDDTQVKYIKPIVNELLNNNISVNNMLSRLIEIYNYEMGNKRLGYGEQQLEELIRDVCDSLKYLATMKSIKIDLILKETLPPVKVDKEEIKKVIFNILENAITYTQENGEITITCYRRNNEITTCITDNGPGIKPEVEKIIFQRYAMAKVIERKIGSGLGLYLSKLIIEGHGGKIWYETKEGEGTSFYFLLKLT